MIRRLNRFDRSTEKKRQKNVWDIKFNANEIEIISTSFKISAEECPISFSLKFHPMFLQCSMYWKSWLLYAGLLSQGKPDRLNLFFSKDTATDMIHQIQQKQKNYKHWKRVSIKTGFLRTFWSKMDDLQKALFSTVPYWFLVTWSWFSDWEVDKYENAVFDCSGSETRYEGLRPVVLSTSWRSSKTHFRSIIVRFLFLYHLTFTVPDSFPCRHMSTLENC